MDQSEELILSYRTWKRCTESIEKDGFREGFEEGRSHTFQKGFDLGFKNGFNYGFEKGVSCGKAKSNNSSYKDRLKNIGTNCFLCTEPEDKLLNTSLEEIIESQKKTT